MGASTQLETRRSSGRPETGLMVGLDACPMQSFDIVYEDTDLLVINKAAGLVCHPTKGNAYSSLIGRVRLYLGPTAEAHMVNRLDRETSGIVLVAKNAVAAAGVRKVWERRAVHKEYVAIVHGLVPVPHVILDARLGRDEQSVLTIKDCVRADGAEAHTEIWLEKTFGRDGRPFSLLRVVPQTGRKHQIRIHLAHFGHPIVGDKMYGGDEDLYLGFVQRRLTAAQWARLTLPCHALHARALRFEWRQQSFVFAVEPEPWFTAFHAHGRSHDGRPADGKWAGEIQCEPI